MMGKGALIGEGMTAEVYEWGPDKVLKLYFDRFTGDWAQHEASVGKAIFEAGVPSPEVFDIIDMENRKGVIFQRIVGKSILEHLEAEPWLLYYYSQRVARLHYRIHQCSTYDIPSQRERFTYMVDRSSEVLGNKRPLILNYVSGLPDGNSVCHGDLHFNNIIITKKGGVAIDWNSAYRGNPLGDVARTCLIFLSPAGNSGIPAFLTGVSSLIKLAASWVYLSEYMRLSGAAFGDIDAWVLPVAAAKLRDKLPGEEKWLMDIINYRLNYLKGPAV